MRVLYDGWSLVHNSISPGALHLLAILTHLPDEVKPIVVLPGSAPAWITGLETHVHHVPDTPFGRLRWEQLHLPRFARDEGLKLLHMTAPAAPVLGNLVALLSPCGFGDSAGIDSGSPDTTHFLTRLRHSFAQGGMVKVKEILWPVDLPAPQIPGSLASLSPILPSWFTNEQVPESSDGSLSAGGLLEHLDLPEEFIIYHGPGDMHSLEHLMQAWNWAAAAIGGSHPLLVLGLDPGAITNLFALAKEYDLEGSLQAVRDAQPDVLSHLYWRCRAVFHPAPASPWSGPVRLALASGKPLVASENEITAAITGPAAYLAPPGDPRALGAALVTVIVEQQVADRLSAAAQRRAANWEMDKFSAQLLRIYKQSFTE
jgi:glycosyltransferase involved in cell wall biosynthesis